MHTQNPSVSFIKTQIQGHIGTVFYQEYIGKESVKKIQIPRQEGIGVHSKTLEGLEVWGAEKTTSSSQVPYQTSKNRKLRLSPLRTKGNTTDSTTASALKQVIYERSPEVAARFHIRQSPHICLQLGRKNNVLLILMTASLTSEV